MSNPTHRNKVSRVVEKYDLFGLGDELARRWKGEQEERQSLRDLADYFNRQVLETVLADADGETIEGEIENLYRLLNDDDVTASSRAQAETKLAKFGINVESLRQDFVSHQAIHTYLTKVRDIESPTKTESPGKSVEDGGETIQRLRSRLVVVTERVLESLRDAGHLSLASFDVLVSVTVYCHECETAHTIAELLDQRGCDCQSDGS